MPALTGMFEYAQNYLIGYSSLIFTNPLTPLVDHLGNPFTKPDGTLGLAVTSDFPGATVNAPIIHVGIEPGQVTIANDYGHVGLTSDGQHFVHAAWARACTAVWTIYTPGEAGDAQRRYLADWLMWGMMTAWATDPVSGQRIDSYIFRQLTTYGIFPLFTQLWRPVEYPSPDLMDPRPLGLPYRAIVRMTFDLQVGWTTQPLTPSAVLVVTPDALPAGALPITIPLPFTLAQG